MLVLTRKIGERLFIGDSVVVTVLRVEGSAVRIGVGAPREVAIVREELLYKPGRVERGPHQIRLPTPGGKGTEFRFDP